MLKSSELQRMVRNNALIRDKNPLWYRLESFELQFGKPSAFLLFTFPLCEEVRSHFGLCSLGSCSDLFFYAHLGAIDLAPGNLAKVGYESGTQTDLHQGSESFPNVSVEELFLSVQTWMSDSLVTCFYRGFSVLEVFLVLMSYLIFCLETTTRIRIVFGIILQVHTLSVTFLKC